MGASEIIRRAGWLRAWPVGTMGTGQPAANEARLVGSGGRGPDYMQIRIVFALAIYLGSYLPLSLILLAQDLNMEVVKRGLCSVTSMAALNCASPFKNTAWSPRGVPGGAPQCASFQR
jgi:hypothetical protein